MIGVIYLMGNSSGSIKKERAFHNAEILQPKNCSRSRTMSMFHLDKFFSLSVQFVTLWLQFFGTFFGNRLVLSYRYTVQYTSYSLLVKKLLISQYLLLHAVIKNTKEWSFLVGKEFSL